jgi:hypothetical protein
MTKYIILISLTILYCSCQNTDPILLNHFMHLEQNISPKMRLKFKNTSQDSIVSIADSVLVSRSHCDSVCQVGLLRYFKGIERESEYDVLRNWFVLIAFHKYVNDKPVNYDEIMNIAKSKNAELSSH